MMRKTIAIIAALAFISMGASAQVPTNGLVEYYPFKGNASDASGNNNNGINNGATLTYDRFGIANSAYDFSSGGYIDFNNILDGTLAGAGKKFSISFWVKPSASNTNNIVLAKHSDAGCGVDEREFFIRVFNDQINVEYYGDNLGSTGRFVCGTTALTDYAKWYHVVVVYDGTINTNNGLDRVTIYLDNQKETTTMSCRIQAGSFPFDIPTSTAHFGVGNYLNNSGTPCLATTRYNGIIDDIRIYNRVVDSTQVNLLYFENICMQSTTVTDTLIINANITSFNPLTYQNIIKIYPNPTHDHITINYGDYATLTGYTLKIINSLGQAVFTTPINQQTSFINLSTWPGNGIYFVYTIDASGHTVDVKKILIQ
jgi:hypothetical protein